MGFSYSLNYATSGEVLLNVTVANNFLTWTGDVDRDQLGLYPCQFHQGIRQCGLYESYAGGFQRHLSGQCHDHQHFYYGFPHAVSVNPSTYNYTFTGSGAIVERHLSKDGTSTVNILNNNTYSGTTTISKGTIQVGNGGTTGSLGTGTIAEMPP